MAALLLLQGGPDIPAPRGLVNDFAGVLRPETRARLDDLAQRVNAATRGDMVVVTLPDLGGRPVEEISLRLGREWKVGANAAVGDAARNAGVVILVVPKETSSDGAATVASRRGRARKASSPTPRSASICRSVTTFIARDYDGAIARLASTVADRYAAEFGVGLEWRSAPVGARRRADRGAAAAGFRSGARPALHRAARSCRAAAGAGMRRMHSHPCHSAEGSAGAVGGGGFGGAVASGAAAVVASAVVGEAGSVVAAAAPTGKTMMANDVTR